MTRYAGFGDLTPFEQQMFIGSAKSWAYSKAHHLGLDPETRMRPLIESDGEGSAKSFYFASKVQEAMGVPLSFEEKMRLQQVMMVYELKGGNLNTSQPLSDYSGELPE
jgi:hypothetical protein